MLPRDDEDFSTLQPSDHRAEPAAGPAIRKAEPAPPRPPAAIAEPPVLSILSVEPVAEICSRFKLSDRAKKILPSKSAPLQFLDVLVRSELFEDATRFLAQALPQREAVGWAYLCARHAHGSQLAAQAETALAAAADWLLDSSEASRLVAQKAALKAGLGTPAGRVCAAAFLSGLDHDLPAPLRKPSKNYTAVGVTATVLCSAVWGETAKNSERFGRFLTEGRLVAGGARPWEKGFSGNS